MKKKILYLFMLLALLCACTNSDTFYEEQTVFEQMTINEFKNKINMDTTTSITVYVYSPSCPYCKKFNPILIKYLENNSKKIFVLNRDKYEEQILEITENKFEVTPSIFTFQNNKVIDYISGLPDENMLYAYFEINPLP